MTSILTMGSPKYVIQISDRRLSKVESLKICEYDPSSNKTIVYRSSDAIVSLGYSGVGYIRGIPTDEWLAECLSGETPLPRGHDGTRPAALILKARSSNCNIGFAVRKLCASINARTEPQQHGLYITIAGWQHNRHRYRPIIIEIEHPPGKKGLISQEPRVWPRGSEFRFHSIGAQLDSATFERAFAPFQGSIGLRLNSGDAERILASIVRQISSEDASVGPDVLSVVLPRPDIGTGYSHFLADQEHYIGIESGGAISDIPVAYSPWIIGPRRIVAPSLVIGACRHELGGLSFEAIGAPKSGSRAFLMSSLQRPPPP